MRETKWKNRGWNPTTGCTKISSGCKNCYAEGIAQRLERIGVPKYANAFRFTLHESLIDLPYTWTRPMRVFVNSMSDLFHQDVPLSFLKRVFAVMADTPQHRYSILTKRSERLALIHRLLPWTPNIEMGVSVENQRVAFRADHLLQTRAHFKFISVMPLIGPIETLSLRGIDRIFIGRENGVAARPLHREWVQPLFELCRNAQVSCYFMQSEEDEFNFSNDESDHLIHVGQGGNNYTPRTVETLGQLRFEFAAQDR